MTADDVRALMRKQVILEKTQTAYAKSLGISCQYLNDILAGRREPGPSVLEALGLSRVVTIQYHRET